MTKYLPLVFTSGLLLTLLVFVSKEPASKSNAAKRSDQALSKNSSTSGLAAKSDSSDNFSNLPRGPKSITEPKFVDAKASQGIAPQMIKNPSKSKTVGHNRIPSSVLALSDEELRERLPEDIREDLISYEDDLSDLDPEHRRYFCWGPDTQPEIIEAFHRAEVAVGLTPSAVTPLAFQFTGSGHWSTTATDGSGVGDQGQPVTLTWSIAPDGTLAPARSSNDPAVASDLIAWLDGLYPSDPANITSDLTLRAWFPLLQEAMDDLSDQAGLTIIYEPNDDGTDGMGTPLSNSAPGDLGVRGDIRLAGRNIDGDFNVLGFAYSPDYGDIVLDTNDIFYDETSNTTGFVNVITHEGGHALGLAHVCPVDQTKLMEPSLTTQFRGVQFDANYSLQRQYGDPLEAHSGMTNNDTIGNATPIAVTNGSLSTFRFLSIDDDDDVDHLSFTATSGEAITVRVIPADATIGTYLEGAQNGNSCSAGTPFNPLEQQDLSIEILAADGTTVLTSADTPALGVTEEIIEFPLPNTGTYYLRIDGDETSRAQLYELQSELTNPPPSPFIAIQSTRIIEESNSGANGVSDPGETVRLGVTLRNDGNLAASNLTGTLNGGRDIFPFSLEDSQASLAIANSTELEFLFSPDGDCGGIILLDLALSDDSGYAATFTVPLMLGLLVEPLLIDEDFDDSPALPTGWTQSTVGGGSPWVVSSASADTPPNAAFSPGVTSAGDAFLLSPPQTLQSEVSTLSFRHSYDIHEGFDGAILQASRDGGDWFDLLASDAVVNSGGYDRRLSQFVGNPTSLGFASAWTGNSGGFITTSLELPQEWAGESLQFRWYLAHNNNTAGTGWFIDSVELSGDQLFECDPFRPTVTLSASATNLTEGDSTSTADLILSTPLPLARNLSATVLISGEADVSDLDEAPVFDLNSDDLSTSSSISAIADEFNEGAEEIIFTLPSSESGFAAGNPNSVTLTIDESFSSWAQSFGILSADPAEDFDKDGEPSLVEYLFNTDPNDNDVLPIIQRIGDDFQFSLLIPTPVSRPDLTVEGEASSNLTDWTSEGVIEINNGYTIPTSADLGFLRLKLTFDPPVQPAE